MMEKYLRINRPPWWRRIYLWWTGRVDFRWELLRPKKGARMTDDELLALLFPDE
jgi:hypothetical protein